MELVDRQHGCGGIVDRRRQRLERNVDDNAKGKGGILIHSAFRPERDRCPQSLFVDHPCAAIKIEQGLIDRDKITDLADEFDDAVRSLGIGYQLVKIYRKNDGRRSLMLNDTIWSAEPATIAFPDLGSETKIGIDAFDHRQSAAADVRQNTDRAQ